MQADSGCVDLCVPAANYNERVAAIDMLLLHYTGMESGEAALRWLCCEESGVSCHYLVHEDGQIVQSVGEGKRAWHAGASCWHGQRDINSCAIGIEIVNPGHEFRYRAFPDVQIAAVISLAHDICQRNSISSERVLAHSDVAPARKQDPGELFPWEQLSAAGVGHFVEPTPIEGGRFFQVGDEGQPIEAMQGLLAAYGYDIALTGKFDIATRDVVIAFQRHFRPSQVDGVADGSTLSTLHRLLRKL